MISVILLAAGESKRMGRLKQLLPFAGSTILERAIDNLLGSSVDEVIVVVGYKASKVMKAIATRPVKVVVNPEYAKGMSTSIKAGLGAVNPETEGIMLDLGDQPLIDSQTISRLVKEFYDSGKGIIIPTYCSKRGHPVIFAAKYRDRLLKLEGDIGARQVVEENPGDILEVAVDCEGIGVDIDTTEDYRLQRSR